MMTTIWSGLSTGSLLSFVAIGYSVTYLGSSVFNFAYANLLMAGIFIAYWGLSSWHLGPIAIVLIGAAIVACMGGIQERTAVRFARSNEGLLIATLGAATLIDGITVVVGGSQPLQVPFFGSSTALTVLGGKVLPVELWSIFGVVVLGVALALVAHHSLVGIAGLAVSEDRQAATLFGIDARKYSLGAFILTGAIAGSAGVIVGPQTFAYTGVSSTLALEAFVALAIGGFGSIGGATFGGFLCGIVEAFSARYLGVNYQGLSLFALLLVVLLCFPHGVFRRDRIRVV